MNIRSFLLCLLLVAGTPALKALAEQPIDFATQIMPLLETHCVACHTEDESEGGLILDGYAALMNGGESGPAITPGTPQSSRMLLMAQGKLEPKMPPESDGLNEQELTLLAEWIEQGAKGPAGDVHDPKHATRSATRFPKIATAASATHPATAVAVAADGQRLAIARFQSVTLQTVAGQVLHRWQDFPGKINGLRFGPDGTSLVVATGLTGKFGEAVLLTLNEPQNSDATTRSESASNVFDVPPRRFQGHRDTLYAAELSPDGRWLATAGYDRQILLWDVESGKQIRSLKGHNGAILSLAFSPDGQLLISGSADETIKVWDVESGERFDTLNQPQGEVLAVAFTENGQHILACSADHRFRVWKLMSREVAKTNPLVTTRYIDDAALNAMATMPGGEGVVVVSETGNAKVLRTSNWNVAATLPSCQVTISDVAVASDGKTAFLSLFDGSLIRRDVPSIEESQSPAAVAASHDSVFLDLGDPTVVEEHAVASESASVPQLPRNAIVRGSIDAAEQVDRFGWAAKAGEVWAIDCDALSDQQDAAGRTGSLDPTIRIEDAEGNVVPRVRLQAVRESYFTFRGKNSAQSNDFRLFGWQDMHLDDYLYSGGEVTRLWMHPRGPDSGFDVYPGEGDRWTYFGTSHVTHALGEPAYVVRPLAAGEEPLANGLPVFEIGFQNDDDPMRRAGSNSRLIFTAPADGLYTVAVSDRRFEGQPSYRYELRIRPARPSFSASVSAIEQPLLRGAGREFAVTVERHDGFAGPVVFDCEDLPAGVRSTFPVVVEAGQKTAHGILWLGESSPPLPSEIEPRVVATANARGLKLERNAGTLGKLRSADTSRATPQIVLDEIHSEAADATEIPELLIRQGETVSAVVKLERAKDFNAEVRFGKEKAGRNATHGVYVDNIGLNGLLLLKGMNQRKFFITADPISKPGTRPFYLKAELDGGITTLPVQVTVQSP